MDPLILSTLTATITALASGTAGEAGRQAWATLAGRVRDRTRPDSPVPAILDEAERQPDESHVQTLLQRLLADDPDATRLLLTWLEENKSLAPAPTVQNTITGNAHIQAGGVYQAHTVHIQK